MSGVHWLDGLGGLLLMLAAMIAITLLALPIFAGQRPFWILAVALPLALLGCGFILYGRYWHISGLPARKYLRMPCQIAAAIVAAERSPIACTVIDISEGGAGLSLPIGSTSGIPENFDLLIEG